MKVGKPGPKLIIGLILALLFGAALFLRVYLPYDKIFTAEGIKFNGTDAYYFMRQVDNLLHNFPHYTSIDPYFLYPGGVIGEVSIRFFVWFLATMTWVIGLGAPTGHTIDVVGVYFPAVLGALTVIPVYFIGKELFGRWAGVFAAGLITVLPGEFLGRSVLGYTDYHIAETLFTTLTMLFLILAIKTASQRQLTFSHLKRRDWVTMAKPAIYSLLAGIFLGIYIFTWQGALLFVFIIAVYMVLQFIIDHLKGRYSDYLSFVGIITFLVALVISWLVAAGTFFLVSEVIVLLSLLVLSGVAHLMVHQKIKSAYYPLVLLGLGLAGLGIFYLISPSFLVSMLGLFAVLIPKGAQLTTMEMQPILFPSGNFSLGVTWGNFPGLLPLDTTTTGLTFGNIFSLMTTSLFLSFIALGMLIYFVIKQGSTEKSLLVVWSLIILLATLEQRRFAYYFAVNVALLSGYLSWRVLGLVDIKEDSNGVVTTQRETNTKKDRPRKASSSVTTTYVVKALSVLIVFFVVFFPNVAPAIDTARQVPFAPVDAWVSSLSWLKENTPDPFGNPDFYYELQKPPPVGENYTYPESAYGVMAWWDYG
ncbi:MAG: glycosyltransferase family 39 protein, partial [Chloroflexi bacterium]|nr:glycosyltransferase family 39 protein [Chloroflexota bacterium]